MLCQRVGKEPLFLDKDSKTAPLRGMAGQQVSPYIQFSRRHQGLLTLLEWMALRAKIGPDEAEPEGCGGPTVKGENEVWPDLRRNPEGRGQFSRFRCPSSLTDTRYASLLSPRTRKNWLPSPPS